MSYDRALEYDAGVADETDTPAVYLAKRMCVDRGHVEEIVPEALALRDAADIVLTRRSTGFEILCIVDRDADPARRFGLTRQALLDVGTACLPHRGSVAGTKLPIVLHVWEVGRGVGSQDDLRRLKALSRRFGGVVIHASAIDSATGRVRSTAPFNGLLLGRRYVERVLGEPRIAVEAWARPEPVVAPAGGVPWVTIALLAMLAVGFVAEQVFAVRPADGLLAPDILTLQALGGLFAPLVDDGQWYRFVTAAFLHAHIPHLLLNGVALFMAGAVLERIFGRTWLLGLFVLGALGGSAMSYAINSDEILSVGASGAIMGLLAAAVVSSFRLPEDGARLDMQMTLLRVLVPSLIPLALRSGGRVDYAAHLGGAIAGGVIGLVLLRTWRITEPRPRFRRAAGVIALGGAAALVLGAVAIARAYPTYVAMARAASLEALLIPRDELPINDEDSLGQAEALVAKYPRDPRARFWNALRLDGLGDEAGVERELRLAIAEQEILDALFPGRRFEIALRTTLAEHLTNAERGAEAREVAAPICAAAAGGELAAALRSLGACP